MNGRELFEIYAEEAHDGQRDLYWDFLKGKERDMWARIAARVEKPEVHAPLDPYKVDASRYPLCDTEVRAALDTPVEPDETEPVELTDYRTDDHPLGVDRATRFRRWASKFTYDSRRPR